MATESQDVDWLGLLVDDSTPSSSAAGLLLAGEGLPDEDTGHPGDLQLDLLDQGWQQSLQKEASPDEDGESRALQEHDLKDTGQQGFNSPPSDLASSARPRYTLRSKDQAPSKKQGQERERQKQEPAPKSLRITGVQSNGFLIPMQPLIAAQAPARSSSLSDTKGASSDGPSHGEQSPAQQSSTSVQPVSGSEPIWRPSNELQEARRSISTSQTSELGRVVTSGKPPELEAGPESQGKAAAAERKRRKKSAGLPTSRVTRSAGKKQQDSPSIPSRGQAQAQQQDSAADDGDQPQGLPDFGRRISGFGNDPAAHPSNFAQGRSQEQHEFGLLMPLDQAGPAGARPSSQQDLPWMASYPSDFQNLEGSMPHRPPIPSYPQTYEPHRVQAPYTSSIPEIFEQQMQQQGFNQQGWARDGPWKLPGGHGFPRSQGQRIITSRPPRHPHSLPSSSKPLALQQAAWQRSRQDEPYMEGGHQQHSDAAVAAMRAEVARLAAQNKQLHVQISEQAYRLTAAEGCEQKVGSLIVKLDRLRCTVAEPSLAQVVDIVQEISEARTPEPSGSNSNYSVLFGRYIANEPGLGIRHGCFDTWFAKKDVTQQHSMVEMTYAYGGGNMLAGEVEMEVACTEFSQCRVKIKELKAMTMEFYISVRTFYMANMAGLVTQIHQAVDEAEKAMLRKTAETILMESACVDHMMVISNPAHFQCTENWVVEEVGPPARDKAEAMERVRDKILEVNGDVAAMRQMFSTKALKALPWRDQENELKMDMEGLRQAMMRAEQSSQQVYTKMIEKVGELKVVLDHQRAIDSAGTVSTFFFGLDPYQMAEVGTAGMPHYPDITYLFERDMLPR